MKAENQTDGLYDDPDEIDARLQRLDHLIERGEPVPVRNYGPLIEHFESVLMREDDQEDSPAPPTPEPE